MREKYFHEYCNLLFPVLLESENSIDTSNYSNYQKRVFGFIAERLANAYLTYAKHQYRDIKVDSRPILILSNFKKDELFIPTIPQIRINKEISSKKHSDVIHVCVTFDDNYTTHADVTITSLLENTSISTKIKCYLLCDARLCATSRKLVEKNRRDNIEFFFIDVDPQLFENLPLNRSHVSINTYYRLIIDRVITNVDKVIYLDSDTLIVTDIRGLWDIDISANHIAGSLDEGGLAQSRRLMLGDDNNYFNAGVLIFNIKKIKHDFADVFIEYLEAFYLNRYNIILQDQDILNIVFKDSSKILPLKWNINSRIFKPNTLDHKYTDDDVSRACRSPGIIHFTDQTKPWDLLCDHPLKDYYWRLRQSRATLQSIHIGNIQCKTSEFIRPRLNGKYIEFCIIGIRFKLKVKKVNKFLSDLASSSRKIFRDYLYI